MKKLFYYLTVLICLALLGGSLAFVSEVTAQPFYKGKMVRIVVYASPGGGYDTYSRLLGRHLSQYIPGNPSIIIQNMPGAGGVVATNYMYNKAPRDGTVFAMLPWRIWGLQLAGDPKAKFDFTKMRAVGNFAMDNAILYTRKDRYANMDAVKRSKQAAKMGCNGRSATGFVLGRVAEEVMGQRYFKYILGYPGSREYNLAIRQGEVDGGGATKDSFMDQMGDEWKKGNIVVIVQTGNPKDGKRDPDFADAPMVSELAETPAAKKIAASTALLATLGRPFWLPPGVPKDRVQLLRDAFWQAMKDKNLLKEAKRLRRPVLPQRGEALQKSWEQGLAAPPEAVKVVKDIFRR